MCEWTAEVLKERGQERWAANFRFASIVYEAVYKLPLFVAPMWFRPDSPEPVGLFSPA
jgi:hypothetical protein